jgi:hypothetical protein
VCPFARRSTSVAAGMSVAPDRGRNESASTPDGIVADEHMSPSQGATLVKGGTPCLTFYGLTKTKRCAG